MCGQADCFMSVTYGEAGRGGARRDEIAVHAKRAVATSAAARLQFEMFLSGRVVPFGALLTIKIWPCYLTFLNT
jgi:hypothetical protein